MTERLSLFLDEWQLHELITEWAKTRGFSHRCNVEINEVAGSITCSITEERTR